MEFLIITDDKLRHLKEAFNNGRLLNMTYLSSNELKEKFYFKIKDEAVFFTMKSLNVSYLNAKELLNNIYYVSLDKEYDEKDKKIVEIQKLKQQLLDNNLLEFNPNFKAYLKRKEVLVDLLNTSNFEENMFKEISSITKVTYEKKLNNKYKHDYFYYQKYEDEINDTFIRIRHLLDNGNDINDIVIMCNDDAYYQALKRYSLLYHIPIHIDDDNNFLSYYQDFLEEIKTNKSYEDILNDLTYDEKHTSELINLINKFYDIKESRYEIFKAELKNKKYLNDKLEDVIEVIPYQIVNEKKYVFFIGLNDSVPKTFKDTDYFSEKEKNIIPIDTYKEKNKNELNKLKYIINNTKMMVLSFSKISNKLNEESSVLSMINYDKKKEILNNDISSEAMRFNMIYDLDYFYKYVDDKRKANSRILNFYQSLASDYHHYDNRFKGLDKSNYDKLTKKHITLSYSAISDYYHCSFSYYLNRILYIKAKEEKKAADLGTFYHWILEKYRGNNFEVLYDEKIKTIDDKVLNFYIEKNKESFLKFLQFIEDSENNTDLKQQLHEHEVLLEGKYSDYETLFRGFIDKVIYLEELEKTYVAIIDFKTGNTQKPDFHNLIYGFNMQLPIYAYLIKNDNSEKKFLKPVFLGIYLQYVFPDDNDYRLSGYTIEEKSLIRLIDNFYENSTMIKRLKIRQDGDFDNYAKTLSFDNIDKLIDICETLIKKAFKNIINHQFDINPKYIKNDNISCTYCHLNYICHKTPLDKVEIEDKKDSQILSQEVNIDEL